MQGHIQYLVKLYSVELYAFILAYFFCKLKIKSLKYD